MKSRRKQRKPILIPPALIHTRPRGDEHRDHHRQPGPRRQPQQVRRRQRVAQQRLEHHPRDRQRHPDNRPGCHPLTPDLPDDRVRRPLQPDRPEQQTQDNRRQRDKPEPRHHNPRSSGHHDGAYGDRLDKDGNKTNRPGVATISAPAPTPGETDVFAPIVDDFPSPKDPAVATIHCKLITPSDCILDDEIRGAVIPGWDGLFGVLPSRAPIVAKLGLGELRLDFADQSKANGVGGTRSYLVEGGFVQMVDNRLTILATSAIPAEEIDAADAKAERAEASARRVPENTPGRGKELEKVTNDRRRAQLKIQLAEQATKRGI
jgi:F-type H+-transporting ATPase subunit epsilon